MRTAATIPPKVGHQGQSRRKREPSNPVLLATAVLSTVALTLLIVFAGNVGGDTADGEERIAAKSPVSDDPPKDREADMKDADPPLPNPGFASVAKPDLPVVEKTGGMRDLEDATTDLPQVPEDVIKDCSKYFSRDLDGLRLQPIDGPVKCNFAVEFEGLVNEWVLLTVPRLPRDLLNLMVVDPPSNAEFELEVDGGEVLDSEPHAWRWQAPETPGIYCVKIVEKTRNESMCFHAAVMKEWDGEETLNGYRIGNYQDKPFRDNPRYSKPRGFIEIANEKQEDTWLSPHFQIKQFVCKQKGDYPKYMIIEPRLLLKLEKLIERLKAGGIDTESLYILSGYRTPWYNKAIGNLTYYSRHLYGDAADLFVDINRDGMMDDLDSDGAVNGDDALVLHRCIQEITQQDRELEGGLGFYDKVNYRNPFIHVDTRGYPARWYK